jgi:hypothetical protein
VGEVIVKNLKCLTPAHTFKVDTGQDWKQTFGCLPVDNRFKLVVITKGGAKQRDVGQYLFETTFQAERWATKMVMCNGPFDV